jgi:hypothetical protein
MEKFMRASGRAGSNTAPEFGEAPREILTSGSGETGELRDMEFIHGPTVTDMRGSSRSA